MWNFVFGSILGVVVTVALEAIAVYLILLKDKQAMNEMLALLRNKKMLLAYIIKMIMSSDNNARGLRSMKDRGFSQEGMLEKCIEVTAIQSEQLKHLALVCMLLVQSDKFDFMVAQAAMKMGNPDEVLKAMFDAKINGGK